MAENKKKVVVYTDWINHFNDLTDDELGKLMRHFFMYINDMNPVLNDRILKIAWSPIETTLKRDLKKWEEYTNKQSINGKKGGRPKKPNETQKTQAFIEKPKKGVNDNVNDNVNDKENDIYISQGHLSITWEDMNKLIDKFGEEKSDDVVRRVLNYRKNTKYKSLYLTALNWLNKEQKELEERKTKRPKLAI